MTSRPLLLMPQEAIMSLLAHLRLLGRHRRDVMIGGIYWRYCGHRSHRWGIPCWRWFFYDGYCFRHNSTCYTDCPENR
jgi:hypothetical protein